MNQSVVSQLAAFDGRSVETAKRTGLAMVVVALTAWIIRVVRYRREFRTLHGSLPAPPFSYLFGTLPGIVKVFSTCPPDAHPHGVFTLLQRKLGLAGLYFLDNWPATPFRQMVVVDPGVATQITQTRVLPKHPIIKQVLQFLCGPTSMLYTEGPMWKRARSMFNSGFALGHLMTLVPNIIEDSLVFRQILADHAASGEILQIEMAARKLAIDVMGRVVLDVPLNSQTSDNELVNAFLAAVALTPNLSSSLEPSQYNPIGYYRRWYYMRIVNGGLTKMLEDRLQARQQSPNGPLPARRGRKPVIDVALDDYETQQREEPTSGKVNRSDGEVKQFAIDQFKTFLLAGHDTTSSALAYVYYLLGSHPAALEKLRKEFDEVFGSDSSLTVNRMKEDPNSIHKLEYTTAAIKETLRLFPPVSAVRSGDGKPVIYDGQSYSTADHLIWIQTHSLHRRPDLFPSADDFIPERFLPTPTIIAGVPKDSWRPFEKGPRACLGQELAMLEIKIILALTLRDFDVQAAYEEWDRNLGRKEPGKTLDGKRGMFGHRAYQVLEATAKPVDGMPVTIKKRGT